jgi:hypothetical protein
MLDASSEAIVYRSIQFQPERTANGDEYTSFRGKTQGDSDLV